MAEANSRDSSLEPEILENPEKSLGPALEPESEVKGYVKAEELEHNGSVFSKPAYSLDNFDSLTDENILLNSVQSARVLENYFGQHSRGDEELNEFLKGFDDNLPDLSSSFVLDLELEDYDGLQHIRYNQGVVAREVIEYLDKDSSWSSRTYFIEDAGKLFIQSSP